MTDTYWVYQLWDSAGSGEHDNATSALIRSFERLPSGWHYGEGRGATKLATKSALAIHRALANRADEVEAFPDISGGILLSGYCGDETLEAFCHRDGAVKVLHEIDGEVVYEQDDVSVSEVTKYVERLLWKLMKWQSVRSSGYFIQDTSAEQRGDLQVWRSRIPQRTAVSRSSIPTVLRRIAERNANTYLPSITPKSRETQQYFGG